MHFLYKITNLVNGKIYIGQTNDTVQRWAQHRSAAKHGTTEQLITKAIAKYGTENFTFEVVLSTQTLEDVNDCEAKLIEQERAMDLTIGYNLDPGGNNTTRGPEVGKKISVARKKYFETHDGWAKGKKFSDAHKAALSKGSMGKPGTNTGKTFDDEWRAKMSESRMGKKFSEETKKRLSESHKGQIPVNRKLTNEIAEQLRADYATDNYTQKQLATKYGLAQSTVWSILKGKVYSNGK